MPPVHIAVSYPVMPFQFKQIEFLLDKHAYALKAIRNFTGHKIQLYACHLLEIRKLGDFQAVQPDFPAKA